MLHQLQVTTKLQLNTSVGSSSVLFFPGHMNCVSELTDFSQMCWNTVAFRGQHLSSALLDPTQPLKQMLFRELVPLLALPLKNCHWLCQIVNSKRGATLTSSICCRNRPMRNRRASTSFSESAAEPGTKLKSTWLPVLPFEHEICSRDKETFSVH